MEKKNIRISDRVRFFKGLRVLTGVGSARHADNINPTPDASSAKFRSHWNSMIWLEIQAWQNDRGVHEQDLWLVGTRQRTIDQALNDVEKFCFKSCRNLPNQADTDCSDDGENDGKCKCIMKTSFQALSTDETLNQSCALQQVSHILEKLSFAESLFCSTFHLAQDFPKYDESHFKQKRDALCAWHNTCTELRSSLTSLMEFLDLLEYNTWLKENMEDPDTSEGIFMQTHSVLCRTEHITRVSCCKVTEAIVLTMDSLLRRINVKNILSLLLKKHFACLVRSFNLIMHSNKTNWDGKQEPNENLPGECCNNIFDTTVNIESVVRDMKEVLPHLEVNEIALNYTEPCTFDGLDLPKLQPIHVFINDIIFAIIGRCLTARLEQVASCKRNCGSSTSILTAQQVVFECKEVIQCCLLSLSVHCLFLKPFISCSQVSDQKSNVSQFKHNLLKIFGTYLDFVKLWVLGQLTGLPHAPRGFMEILDKEWTFAQQISVKIDVDCFITCACKCVEICKDVFVSTQNFLTAASIAIVVTRCETPASGAQSPDDLFNEEMSPSKKLQHSSSYPSSPKAGILWFHRQRSESRHLAHRHSVIQESDSPLLSAGILTNCYSRQASSEINSIESTRRYLYELSRAVRDLFDEARERTMKSISFAKSLRKDLEPAIEFDYIDFDLKCKHNQSRIYCKKCGLLFKLKASCYVKVEFNLQDVTNHSCHSSQFHPNEHWVFISQEFVMSHRPDHLKTVLLQRFVSSCSTSRPNMSEATLENIKKTCDAILILRALPPTNQEQIKKKGPNQAHSWTGDTVTVTDDDITKFSRDVIQLMNQHLKLDHDFTALSQRGVNLGQKRSQLSKMFGAFLTLEVAQSSVVVEIKESIKELHNSVLSLCNIVLQQVNEMSRHLQKEVMEEAGFTHEEESQLFAEINHVVQKSFYFGFECMREAVRIFSGPVRREMELLNLKYVKSWMEYVLEFIPRGKGRKPRWAACGLNSLINLSMDLVRSLSNDEYNQLVSLINKFLDHLIGSRSTHDTSKDVPTDVAEIYRSFSSNSSKEDIAEYLVPTADSTESNRFEVYDDDYITPQQLPMEQINMTIADMDSKRDTHRINKGIIGCVVETPAAIPVVQLGVRTVSFRWQRGTKIGEGTFGRVYTCVNMDNGKLIAMKEIPFQANDEKKIQGVLEEITNFEGINHQNLVKYHGVELHRDQMYIFMEYCDSGTLEEVSRIGLPEAMIQQYTSQIVAAVYMLHNHGIVHRDIKGGNIFLTSSGLLKIGDFGSAVRLLDRTRTLPGEIASHAGITAAYTAPEVINSSVEMGYGRGADVWSVGCVVIEMASGKRPWYDHEPIQIMYKVGMGCKPVIPSSLTNDGFDFVEHCLEINPQKRWTIGKLQTHPFVKVAQPTPA